MAYITVGDINGLTLEDITIPSETPGFITAQIDATFTTQFELLDETYYMQMGESTEIIVLKTPLYPIDISNVYYTDIINVTTLANIVESGENNYKLSP